MALKKVVSTHDIVPTDTVDNHVAQLFLLDFEQSGIHLSDDRRAKVVYLNDCILYTGQQFAANAMRPSVIDRETLPTNIRP